LGAMLSIAAACTLLRAVSGFVQDGIEEFSPSERGGARRGVDIS